MRSPSDAAQDGVDSEDRGKDYRRLAQRVVRAIVQQDAHYGVGRAVAAATRSIDQPNDLALFFDIASKGISRATQEITDTGSAEPETAEAREFARRLGGLLDANANAVPIEHLYCSLVLNIRRRDITSWFFFILDIFYFNLYFFKYQST